MMVASEADEAWCPPTFRPSALSRTWLAWWMVQLASHSTFFSSSKESRGRRRRGGWLGGPPPLRARGAGRGAGNTANRGGGGNGAQNKQGGGGGGGRPFRRRARGAGGGGGRMQRRGGEPMVELLAAALARRPHRLPLAFVIVGRAVEPDVEMKVVSPPRLHLAEPGSVAAGVAAERLLDRRVDEDALDLRVLRRRLDHLRRASASRPSGSTSLRFGATTMVADISSRSSGVSSRSGIGVSQMSASSPT